MEYSKNNTSLLYLIIICLAVSIGIISAIELSSGRSESARLLNETIYKKAWIDGANSSTKDGWVTSDEAMKYYRRDSLVFIGSIYSK